MSERECVVCRGSGNVAMDVALYRANVQACSGTLDPRGDKTDCPVVLAQRGLRTYDPTTCVDINRQTLWTLSEAALRWLEEEAPDWWSEAECSGLEADIEEARELLEGDGG